MKILVADKLSPAAIDLLKAQPDCELTVSDPQNFHQFLADAEGLLVRSAAKVPKAVLAKAPNLRAIGRAGIGVRRDFMGPERICDIVGSEQLVDRPAGGAGRDGGHVGFAPRA